MYGSFLVSIETLMMAFIGNPVNNTDLTAREDSHRNLLTVFVIIGWLTINILTIQIIMVFK